MLRVLIGKNLSPIVANRLHIAHLRRYRFDRELEYSSFANKRSSLSAESLTEMIVRVISKNCTVHDGYLRTGQFSLWYDLIYRRKHSLENLLRAPARIQGQFSYFSPTTMEWSRVASDSTWSFKSFLAFMKCYKETIFGPEKT